MPCSPVPPVDSLPPIDNTFGALLIATFLATTLYGLVVHQCYRYFKQYSNDGICIKLLVAFTLVFETVHIVLSTHFCYYYLVTSAINPDARRSSVWSLQLLSVATAIVAVPSQTFFARRIFRLGGRRYRVLVVLVFILLAGEFGFLCVGTIEAFIFTPFSEFQPHTWLISAAAGIAFVADGFITAVLVNLLRSKHIGLKRMDVLLNTLILYTINTGLLTGTLDFLAFLFGLIYPNNLMYVGFGIITTKLYANSLLAALNTRKSLRYGQNFPIAMSAIGSSTLASPRRRETTNLSGVTQVEVQDPVITPPKTESAENSQAFLTLELVGMTV